MPAHERPNDETLIRQLLDDYAEAIRHKDAEAALSYLADDAVCFDLAPPLRFGGPESAGSLQEWFETWRSPIDFESRDLRVAVGGDVAFAHALRRMVGVKTDGQRVDLWYRATCGLRKEKGEWKIVHVHDSVPFYMDGSLRAAVDLKP
jgi:PhnB protein